MMTTIRDVAKESGVSVATVSYVLNDGPRSVSPTTRARVISAMKRLDYHPSAIARSLVRKRTNTIGILVGDDQSEVVTNSYYTGVLGGVFSGAKASGYNITFFIANRSDADIEYQIRAQRPDAMLMIAPRLGQSLLRRLNQVGIPLGVVGAGESYQEVATICVDVDNVTGMRLAMEHLYERGPHKIVYIIGDPNQESTHIRRQVFEQVQREHGTGPSEQDFLAHSFSPEVVYAAVQQRLEQNPNFTAMVAGNDGIAVAALQAVRDSGRRVPEDIAVIGYDDWPVASYMMPGLTTIRQPMHEIGEAVVQSLTSLLESKLPLTESLRLQRLSPTLIVRGST